MSTSVADNICVVHPPIAVDGQDDVVDFEPGATGRSGGVNFSVRVGIRQGNKCVGSVRGHILIYRRDGVCTSGSCDVDATRMAGQHRNMMAIQSGKGVHRLCLTYPSLPVVSLR